MQIHWARIAAVGLAVVMFRVAEAQVASEPTPNETVVARTPQSTRSAVGLPPAFATTDPLLESLARPARLSLGAGQPLIAPPERPMPLPIVMYGGMGGSITEHQLRFSALGRSSVSVEMRGGCWSACTLITSHVPKERLCFAPGAFLAFHAAVANLNIPLRSESATRAMFDSYPPEIKYWINVHGGVANLEVGRYWTMRDHELWAIGYPRCK